VRFDYTRFDSSRLRPLVDVVVRHGGREASYALLVDSGADINVFSGELARELGITLEDGEMLEVRAATGDEAILWRHPVTISVGSHRGLFSVGVSLPHVPACPGPRPGPYRGSTT